MGYNVYYAATALHVAASCDLETVELLLVHGALVDAVARQCGETALVVAVRGGDEDMVRFLLGGWGWSIGVGSGERQRRFRR